MLVGIVVVLVVRSRRHNNTKPTTRDMAMMSPRYRSALLDLTVACPFFAASMTTILDSHSRSEAWEALNGQTVSGCVLATDHLIY